MSMLLKKSRRMAHCRPVFSIGYTWDTSCNIRICLQWSCCLSHRSSADRPTNSGAASLLASSALRKCLSPSRTSWAWSPCLPRTASSLERSWAALCLRLATLSRSCVTRSSRSWRCSLCACSWPLLRQPSMASRSTLLSASRPRSLSSMLEMLLPAWHMSEVRSCFTAPCRLRSSGSATVLDEAWKAPAGANQRLSRRSRGALSGGRPRISLSSVQRGS
mmetsp:Transcript_29719/g.64746  ORF Transcript_29719/g.64746 Transcript_29719/m.64746 type:complete len:219 (+) Transcript_29719:470-1126(+)